MLVHDQMQITLYCNSTCYKVGDFSQLICKVCVDTHQTVQITLLHIEQYSLSAAKEIPYTTPPTIENGIPNLQTQTGLPMTSLQTSANILH